MIKACSSQSSTKNGVNETLQHSAALRSTTGCTVLRENLRHCQISGERGQESGLPTRSLNRNENSRDKSQTAVFLRWSFSPFFSLRFSPHFSLHFSPCLSPGSCLLIVVPGNFHSCHHKVSMSNEVGQHKLTLKNMPSWRRGQTCLKHTACHIHCA